MFFKYLMDCVNSPQFGIDTVEYSESCEVSIAEASEDLIMFHWDMVNIAAEEGSPFFN